MIAMTTLKTQHVKKLFGAGLLAIMLAACNTHTVKTTSYTPIVQDSQDVAEDLLLDVGVAVFDPGIDEIDKRDEETTNHEIRVAESRYAPFLLAETLQRSANWGIVRLMPNNESPMDVIINGTILQSDGEAMQIRIEVNDSSGREWYTKVYSELISQFSYESSQRQQADPFQVIYNKISNDLLEYRKRNLTNQQIVEIRTISELLFARRFSPEVFDSYLTTNRQGNLAITALPAETDPVLKRVRDIRERDFMFIDTVQDYYATYARQMRIPYDSWRESSYDQTIELRQIRASANRRFIGGAVALVGGVAAATNGGNIGTQLSGATAVSAGAYLLRAGINKLEEASMQISKLEELNITLENTVAPRVFDLDDRTITLTGSVEEQYAQWKEVLADIYASDVGDI